MICNGTGEGAFLVAEEFAFKEIFADRAAVYWHKWAFFSRAVEMQKLGHHFFSGAAFSTDENGDVILGQIVDLALDLQDGFVLSDQLRKLVHDLLAEQLVFAGNFSELDPGLLFCADHREVIEAEVHFLEATLPGGLDQPGFDNATHHDQDPAGMHSWGSGCDRNGVICFLVMMLLLDGLDSAHHGRIDEVVIYGVEGFRILIAHREPGKNLFAIEKNLGGKLQITGVVVQDIEKVKLPLSEDAENGSFLALTELAVIVTDERDQDFLHRSIIGGMEKKSRFLLNHHAGKLTSMN